MLTKTHKEKILLDFMSSISIVDNLVTVNMIFISIVFIMVIIMTTIIIHSDHARLFANHNC